jgi:hypothetical protein
MMIVMEWEMTTMIMTMTTMSGGNVRRRRSAQQVRRAHVFLLSRPLTDALQFIFLGPFSLKAEKEVANAKWMALTGNHTIT